MSLKFFIQKKYKICQNVNIFQFQKTVHGFYFYYSPYLKFFPGTSLVLQWLRLCICKAGGTGSIPAQGTKIPHAVQCSQEKKKKKFILPQT